MRGERVSRRVVWREEELEREWDGEIMKIKDEWSGVEVVVVPVVFEITESPGIEVGFFFARASGASPEW